MSESRLILPSEQNSGLVMAPPLSETEAQISPLAQLSQQEMDRRTALKFFAVVGGMLALGEASPLGETLRQVQRENWPHHALAIVDDTGKDVLSRKRDQQFTSAALFAPGFGGRNWSELIGGYRKQKIYPASCALGCYSYDTTLGVTSESVQATSQTYAQHLGIESLELVHGESLGGMISTDAMIGAGLPVGTFVVNCSPFDVYDAFNGMGAEVAAFVEEYFPIKADLKTATLFNFYDDQREKGWKFLAQALDPAGRIQLAREFAGSLPAVLRGEDIDAMLNEMLYYANTDLATKAEQLKGILTAETQAYYAFPINANTDQTVQVERAFGKWQAYLLQFGITLLPLRYDQPGHANTGAAIRMVTPLLEANEQPWLKVADITKRDTYAGRFANKPTAR